MDGTELPVVSDVRQTYYACTGLSTISFIILLGLFFTKERYRKFPGSLAILRSICDFIFTCSILGQQIWFEYMKNPADCSGPFLRIAAFLTQFSLMGSLCWFFFMAFNLKTTLDNPFKQPQRRMARYHVLTWTMAGVTGFYSAISPEFDPEFEFCWIPRASNGVNVAKVFTLHFWILVFFIASVKYLTNALLVLRNGGFRASLSHRERIITQSGVYTLSFLFFWAPVGSMYMFYSLTGRPDSDLRLTLVAFVSLLGVWDFISLLIAMSASQLVFKHHIITFQRKKSESNIKFGSPLSTPTSERTPEKIFPGGDHHQLRSNSNNSSSGVFSRFLLRYFGVLGEALVMDPINEGESSDLDLSLVLRRDFIRYTTLGIEQSALGPTSGGASVLKVVEQSVEKTPLLSPRKETKSETKNYTHLTQKAAQEDVLKEPASLQGLSEESCIRQLRAESKVKLQLALCESSLASSGSGACQFLDCAPSIFRRLRKDIYKIADDVYCQSFTGGNDESNIQNLSANFSAGKSGSFFYFSSDKRYMVKTMESAEFRKLLHILPKYYLHYRKNPNSLIIRFFGCHQIVLYNAKVYVVVMENIFFSPDPKRNKIHEKYDLKGSWVARRVGHEDLAKRRREGARRRRHGSSKPPSVVYKDEDLKKEIALPKQQALEIMRLIEADSSFFVSCNIMDYSLLLGVHYCREKRATQGHCDEVVQAMDSRKSSAIFQKSVSKEQFQNFGVDNVEIDVDATHVPFYREEDGGIRAEYVEGPGVYFLGIVDILQEWDYNKRLERFAKTAFLCRDGRGLSAIEPKKYAQRFVEKMSEHFGVEQFSWESVEIPSFESHEPRVLTDVHVQE